MGTFDPALGKVLLHKHAGGTIPVKDSGAEVTTGTDDAKFATPKALADAGVNTRLKSKIITATRDLAAGSGDVSYTGVGFTPTSMLMLANINLSLIFAIALVDSAKATEGIEIESSTFSYKVAQLQLASSSGAFSTATVKSWDADGFTLTWTKTGSAGTANLIFLCFR